MSEDVKVSQSYRKLGAEEPPRALDEAILAAARREAGAGPTSQSVRSSRQRWYAPLAAAAVLVLAVAVTLNMQLERPGIESAVPQAPSPARAKESATELTKEAAIASRKKDQSVPAVAPAVAPAPKPFVAADVAAPAPTPGEAARSEAAGAGGALARQAEERGSRNDQAERVPQLRSSRAMAKREGSAELQAQQGETPERQLERIAELRARGRHDEADGALAQFRKGYPDYKIPEAMRERIERRQ